MCNTTSTSFISAEELLEEKAAFGYDEGTYYQINQGQWQKINSDLFYSMLEGYPVEFGNSWWYQELTTLK